MSAEVYVKNIPLSYLKSQNQSFFGSDSFNNAVALFDKFKRTVKKEDSESLDKTIYPLDTLLSILKSKYNGVAFETKDKNTIEDIIFINFSGKVETGNQIKPRKYITKCMKDLNESGTLGARTIINNTLIASAKKAKENLSVNVLDNSYLKDSIKPSNTNNILLDLRNKANYYADIYHPEMYDDKAYKYSILKQVSANYNFPITAVPLEKLKDSLDDKYQTRNKDILSAMSMLKGKLINKYLHVNGIMKDEYNSIGSTITSENEIQRFKKNIDVMLSNMKNKSRFKLFKYDTLDNSFNYTIGHNLNSEYLKISAIDLTGQRIPEEDYSIVINDKASVSITFENRFNGSVLLLADDVQSDYIDKYNFYQYESIFSTNIFEKYRVTTKDRKITLNIVNYNKLYGFFETFKFDTKEKLPFKTVEFLEDSVNIYFDADYSNIEVFFLSSTSLLSGTTNIKVNSDNIYTFLANYSVFSDNISMWHISQGNI